MSPLPPYPLVLDLETQGLNAEMDSITCVGILTQLGVRQYSSPFITWKYGAEGAESELLLQFFRQNPDPGPSRLITFNGSGFDLNFLKTRVMKLGLDECVPAMKKWVHHPDHVDLAIFSKQLMGRNTTKDEACSKFADQYVPRKSAGLWTARVYKYPEALTVYDHVRLLQHNAVDLGATYCLYERLMDFPDFRQFVATRPPSPMDPNVGTPPSKPTKNDEIAAFL